MNEVFVTDDEYEFTYDYTEFNDNIYSIASVSDSNVTLYGWNNISFKKRDLEGDLLLETNYIDSLNLSACYYGMSEIYGEFYQCGTESQIGIPDTLYGFVIKFDSNGVFKWKRRYHLGNESVRIAHMDVKQDTLCFLANITQSSNLYTIMSMIDTAGNIIDNTNFIGLEQQGIELSITTDNHYLVTCLTQESGGSRSYVHKLDADKNIIWSKLLGGTSEVHYLQMTEMPNGNYLGFGYSEEDMSARPRAWLVELNPLNGNIIKDTLYWFGQHYSAFSGYANMVFKNNQMIFTGVSNESLGGLDPYDAFICSIDYNFEVNWLRKFTRSESDNGFYSLFEKDNFYYAQGLVFADGNTYQTNDEWFLVVDSLGCDDLWCTVGVDMSGNKLESVLTVYPNPSNGEFIIKLEEHIQNGEIIVTDLAYKPIKRFSIRGTKNVDLGYLSTGVYLIHLQTEDVILETKKLVIYR